MIKIRFENYNWNHIITTSIKTEEVTYGNETMAMTLIAHSGDARTLAFQALQAAKKHNFEEADRLIGESKKAISVST